MSTAVATTAGIKRKESSTTSTSMTTTTTTTKKKTKGGYDVPWVEKYRPRNLDDVVGNEDTLVRLRAIAEDGNMPNLILCGPPGTGKVSDGSHCINAKRQICATYECNNCRFSAVTFVICSQQINISCHLIHRVIGFVFSPSAA